MARISYARKDGKIEVIRTETHTLSEEELLDRQFRLRDELRAIRENIKMFQQKERELVEELAALQALVSEAVTKQAEQMRATEEGRKALGQ